jgi:hypothetical protein
VLVLPRRAPILSSTCTSPHAAPAVAKKQSALSDSGNTLVLMLSKMPVTSGAMIPESLERAEAIPDAVPLSQEEERVSSISAGSLEARTTSSPHRDGEDFWSEAVDHSICGRNDPSQRVSMSRAISSSRAEDAHMRVEANDTAMLLKTIPTEVLTYTNTTVAADVANVEMASVLARPRGVSTRYAPTSEPGRPETVYMTSAGQERRVSLSSILCEMRPLSLTGTQGLFLRCRS